MKFKKMFTKSLLTMATLMLTLSANSRCMFIYHQPEVPKDIKKYRKF